MFFRIINDPRLEYLSIEYNINGSIFPNRYDLFSHLMARYTVLRHTMPPHSVRNDHFDILLENGDMLATWEIKDWPPQGAQAATRLPDHRPFYLDYEGPIDGRGSVKRVCAGTFQFRTDPDGTWLLDLQGATFQGRIYLKRGSVEDSPDLWTLSTVLSVSDKEESDR